MDGASAAAARTDRADRCRRSTTCRHVLLVGSSRLIERPRISMRRDEAASGPRPTNEAACSRMESVPCTAPPKPAPGSTPRSSNGSLGQGRAGCAKPVQSTLRSSWKGGRPRLRVLLSAHRRSSLAARTDPGFGSRKSRTGAAVGGRRQAFEHEQPSLPAEEPVIDADDLGERRVAGLEDQSDTRGSRLTSRSSVAATGQSSPPGRGTVDKPIGYVDCTFPSFSYPDR